MNKPVVLVVSYALLLGAWAMTNPPGAAPDEYGHYLRALAAGRGILAPDERPPPLPPHEASQAPLRWQRRQSRIIKVEGRLSPESFNACLPRVPMPAWDCPKPQPDLDEDAWLLSIVGTYPPLGYLAPGIFSRMGDRATPALLWGRAAAALSAALFLGLAAWALWDPKKAWVCMLGLLAAITPMVMFVGASLTPSGVEIASGICFAACLLRLGREGQKGGGWIWVAAGTSGAVLALSRDPGMFWVAGLLILCVALSGRKSIWANFKNSGQTGLVSLAVLLAGLAAAGAWQVIVQVHPPLDPVQLVRDFPDRLHITKEVGRQQVGVFGWLDTILPSKAYIAWTAMLGLLGVMALWCGCWVQRSVLALSAAAAVAVPVAVDIVQREVGFGVQGRHVLAFTAIGPLMAGEILTRNAHMLNWMKRLRPTLWFGAVAASVNCLAWLFNARRYTTGPGGRIRFWEAANAAPPLSWTAWLVIVGAAGLLVLVFSGLTSFSGEPQEEPAALGAS